MKKTTVVILGALLSAFVTERAMAACPNRIRVSSLHARLPDQYVAGSPSVQFSASSITFSAANGVWVLGDQYLKVQVNHTVNDPCPWAIQMYTDNVAVANPGAAAPTIQTPGYIVAPNNSVEGAVIASPATPAPTTPLQFLDSGDGLLKIPSNGLVSADGESQIPLIWRVFGALPSTRQPAAVCQRGGPTHSACPAVPSTCDFSGCAWAYLLDRNDRYVNLGEEVAQWQDNYWYTTPANSDGYLSVINPTSARPRNLTTVNCTLNNGATPYPFFVDSNGRGIPYCSYYLYFASNFAHATRQKYSSTIFLELLLL